MGTVLLAWCPGQSTHARDKRTVPTIEQAKKYNVPAPYNTLIVDLIHAIEGAYQYHK